MLFTEKACNVMVFNSYNLYRNTAVSAQIVNSPTKELHSFIREAEQLLSDKKKLTATKDRLC